MAGGCESVERFEVVSVRHGWVYSLDLAMALTVEFLIKGKRKRRVSAFSVLLLFGSVDAVDPFADPKKAARHVGFVLVSTPVTQEALRSSSSSSLEERADR